jgi:hypothetical protein
MFDARAFAARQFGCKPEDFTIVGPPVAGYRGLEAEYVGDLARVRVLISQPRGKHVLAAAHTADLHRRVVLTWPSGQVAVRIGVDEEVAW